MKAVNFTHLISSDLEICHRELYNDRLLLERCWSKSTAHPKTEFDMTSRISKGQCFVTSLYLYNKFKNTLLKDFSITIKRGSVETLDSSILIEDHCWLEIKSGNNNVHKIIDITADQSIEINDEVLIGDNNFMEIQHRIRYVANRSYSGNEIDTLSLNTKKRFRILLNRYEYRLMCLTIRRA